MLGRFGSPSSHMPPSCLAVSLPAGITWSSRYPLAAVALYPDRRFDYVLSAWPRRGGVGHPTHCELLGVVADDQLQYSDHYGVLADLRY